MPSKSDKSKGGLISSLHVFQVFCECETELYKKFQTSPFLSQLTQEKVMYLKRKNWKMENENSHEIVSISTMGTFKWVLVKLVLLQSEGRDNF